MATLADVGGPRRRGIVMPSTTAIPEVPSDAAHPLSTLLVVVPLVVLIAAFLDALRLMYRDALPPASLTYRAYGA